MDNSLNLSREFDDLVRELRICNRHFVQSPIVEKIRDFVLDIKQYSLVTNENRLYRARICTPDDCDQLGLQDRMVKYGTFSQDRLSCSKKDPITNMFAGFDASKCGAPPSRLCGENRANGKGIKRLYVTESARTAIAETKPSLGNLVSISELQPQLPPFMVLDLTKHSADNAMNYLRELIDKQFSLACIGDSDSYSFTQWFSDLVSDLGNCIVGEIDHGAIIYRPKGRGIKYSSAMHIGGRNLVIFGLWKDGGASHPFNTEYDSEVFFDVKPIRSEIYLIRNVVFDLVQFKFERGDIFELEEL